MIGKRDLAEYYLAVADAALVHLRKRPTMRSASSTGGGRVLLPEAGTEGAPDWLESATVHFPSGRSARELCANDAAHLSGR